MDISRFLSRSLGLYLIIVSIAFILDSNNFIRLTQELTVNSSLLFFAGFVTLILGILLIVSHNIWQFNWKVIITILGWIFFIKGSLIMLYPQAIVDLSKNFIENSLFAYISIGIDFVLGLVLLYFGFRRL